jgi:aspartate/methionine/tyrosine aminotransferase
MPARRTATFTESVIREMTRVAQEHGAINLAQGFPDFPMPTPMKDAACAAIQGDVNQYAITWGAPPLRIALAEKYRRWYEMEVNPDREVTVTCGATEAMASVFLALIDPGDEVIVLEPFYENYGPDAILAEAKPKYVSLRPPNWELDRDALRAAFSPKTKAIVLNTPHNPSGRVFTREEVALIAELCVENDVWAFTDGPYEHMIYSGHHHEIATFPGMRERTVTISSLSKTWSCTGDECNQEGARLPDCWCACAAAGGSGGWDGFRRRLLQPLHAVVSREARPALVRTFRSWFSVCDS